jgi:hypothetical protein
MKNENIRTLWVQFLESDKYSIYFIDNETKWKNTLNELMNFIDKYKKRPSETNINNNEKYLAKWIIQHRLNYAKKK